MDDGNMANNNIRQGLKIDFNEPRKKSSSTTKLLTPSIVPATPIINANLHGVGIDFDINKVDAKMCETLSYTDNYQLSDIKTPLDLKSPPLIPTTVKEEMASSSNIFNDSTNLDNLDKHLLFASNTTSDKHRNTDLTNQTFSNDRDGSVSRCGSMSIDSDNRDSIDRDQLKIERKRERNRLAASKCRRRKVERIEELERMLKEKDEEINRLKKLLDKQR